jgi:hypothetical protein
MHGTSWDDKWFFMEQDMVSKGRHHQKAKIHATAFVKATFLEKGKSLSPQRILEEMSLSSVTSPPIPSYMTFLNEGQALQYTALKERDVSQPIS